MSETWIRPPDDELDELLGAYALDAVTGEERRALDEYVRMNPRAAAEVNDHREVATMLAYSGADAPAGLWDRIASELDPPAPPPRGELAKVIPVEPARRRRSRLRGVAPWLAATAAAAVVAFVAVQVVDAPSDPGDPVRVAAEAARGDLDSTVVELRAEGVDGAVEAVVDEAGHGYLIGDDLPSLGDTGTYQLWGVYGEAVISLGPIGPEPGIVTFTVTDDVEAIAITIEEPGGVLADGNPEGAYVGTFG